MKPAAQIGEVPHGAFRTPAAGWPAARDWIGVDHRWVREKKRRLNSIAAGAWEFPAGLEKDEAGKQGKEGHCF